MEINKWSVVEKYFFFSLSIINLIPVLFYKFFPTLDGPAHLYNATIINQLLAGNEYLEKFFRFNPEPVPNWTGHFLLSCFNLLLPAFIAEKLLLVLYLLGLPFSFRSLIKTIASGNVFISYYIFPFTYSFLFFLGFYNFCVGLVFLFS